MKITVNGEEQQIEDRLSLLGLLTLFDLPREKIAVERNMEIVPKSAYETVMLDDGDRLEIVHFIGGG